MIPGPIVLFGSGETSPTGQKIFDHLLRLLPASPQIAVLETPAGFELNSAQVAGRIADFLSMHLQNYHPQVTIIPARKRGTANSPDDPGIVAPLFRSDLIFMGPGSPTYAIRQLRGSLAWAILVACHRQGGALGLSSAAVVAVSAQSLPVYEIYKAGEDIHWVEGLDLLGSYGLRLVFIPHWDNSDGGAELDTSRCWMGSSRFDQLTEMLSPGITLVGIDEKTALLFDFSTQECQVIGSGGVTLFSTGDRRQPTRVLGSTGQPYENASRRLPSGERFPIGELGEFHLPGPGEGLPAETWQQAQEMARQVQHEKRFLERTSPQAAPLPPGEVAALVERREAARRAKDWRAADALRAQITSLGWIVIDTPGGPKIEKQK